MLLDLQPSYFTKQFKYRHWIRLARMAQKITIQKAGCVVESSRVESQQRSSLFDGTRSSCAVKHHDVWIGKQRRGNAAEQ